MNVEIGTDAALFPEKEYINGIAVAVHSPESLKRRFLTMKTLTGTRLHLVHEKSYRLPPRTCKFTRIFLASNEVGNRRKSANDREGCRNISYDGRGLRTNP